jgi:hypothetical protein
VILERYSSPIDLYMETRWEQACALAKSAAIQSEGGQEEHLKPLVCTHVERPCGAEKPFWIVSFCLYGRWTHHVMKYSVEGARGDLVFGMRRLLDYQIRTDTRHQRPIW